MTFSTGWNASRRGAFCGQWSLWVIRHVAAVTMLAALAWVPVAQGACCVCNCPECSPCGNCSISGCCGSAAITDLAECTQVCTTLCSMGSVVRFTTDADCSGGVADTCTAGDNLCVERASSGFCNSMPTATTTATETATPSDTPSSTPTITATATLTETATITPADTPTATATSTGTATATGTGTPPNTPSSTPTITATGTVTRTATITPPPTATATATSTPTVTPTGGVPNGGACDDPADCMSGNCVDNTCCAEPVCPPAQSCDNPGHAGMCSQNPAAAAPALSRSGVLAAAALLLALGGLAVRRRRGGV